MGALEPGTVIAGRYAIEATIGAGTMGTVHRARRIADGMPCALKLLAAEAMGMELRRRFEREAKALAATAHPNVLSVIELGDDPRGPFLITELLGGRSLDAILGERRLDPALALAIADQVLAALAHAHALGIVHRDVKPGNVHIEDGPGGAVRVKLLDFGLAKFSDEGTWGPQSVLTHQGAIVGTPAYMAPEQVFGPAVDARTDVYAAGVLMFELLTGTWPFVAEDNADMIRAHAMSPPPSLAESRPDSTFHPELEALIARALAKKPRERWQDAQQMREHLARIPKPAARR